MLVPSPLKRCPARERNCDDHPAQQRDLSQRKQNKIEGRSGGQRAKQSHFEGDQIRNTVRLVCGRDGPDAPFESRLGLGKFFDVEIFDLIHRLDGFMPGRAQARQLCDGQRAEKGQNKK